MSSSSLRVAGVVGERLVDDGEDAFLVGGPQPDADDGHGSRTPTETR